MTAKKVSSPYSTGGGGVDFESQVGAHYLAAMLLGSIPRGINRVVNEVQFQRHFAGEPLDDLIILSDSPDGRSKLALQVKRDLAFGDEDETYNAVMRACWSTFTSSKFDKVTDRFGVALGLYSKKVDEHYQSVLTWARNTASAKDFFGRIRTEGLSSQTQRTFVELVERQLAECAGRKVAEHEVWEFLKAMVLLHFDFQIQGSRDLAYSTNQLSTAGVSPDPSFAVGLFSTLISISAEAKRTAGSHTDSSVRKRLAEFGCHLLRRADYREDVERIQTHASRILADIRQDVDGLTLPRFGLVNTIEDKLREHRVVALVGPRGTGKSAVLKELAIRRMSIGPVFILSGDRLEGNGWDGFAAVLQIRSDLSNLLVALSASESPTLFLDGVDRVTDPGHRRVVNDVLRAICAVGDSTLAPVPRWTVVATSRQPTLSDVGEWLERSTFGGMIPVRVPELTDDEIRLVTEHVPRLQRLAAKIQVRSILRNPMMLKVLCDPGLSHTGAPIVPATEIELADAWWERVVGRDAAAGRARQQLMLSVGEQAARSPGRWHTLVSADAGALFSLEQDQFLLRDPARDAHRIAHDVFEDWIVARILNQHLDDFATCLHDLGQPLGLERPVQLVGCGLLERSADPCHWCELLRSLDECARLQLRWGQALVTSPLGSTRAEELLETLTKYLLDNDAVGLKRLLAVVRATEMHPDESLVPYIGQLGDPGDDPIAVLMRVPVPVWSIWQPVAKWLAAHSDALPHSARPPVAEFMDTWQSKSPYRVICRREFGTCALAWFAEEHRR